MPLDLDETGALAVTDDDGSAGRIIVDDARRVHVMGAGEMNLGAGSIHVSHFVTCPQGAEWSGKGKGV